MSTVAGFVFPVGGAPATNRRTLLDIVDELVRPVDASDTTYRALAGDAFRSAIRTMDRKGLWPWEVLDEDVAITAGQRFSSTTGVIKKPLAMHLLNSAGGTRDRKLTYVSYDRFVEKYNMDFNADPWVYTIPNLFETGQIRWHPIPSSNDNARFTYYRSTPAPKNEQDTVEIPDYITEVYMSMAWYEFLKRLPSEARPFPISIARVEAKDAFREISAHVNTPGDRTRMVSGIGAYY